MAEPDIVVDLTGQVDRVLWDFDAVRTAHRPLQVRVRRDGRVILLGPVRSRFVRDQVLDLVRAIPGVAGVVDKMTPDPDVELAVAEALSRDSRTSSLPPGSVRVRSLYGSLTLTGPLPAGSGRAAVPEVAAAVPGVIQVHDRLT